MLGSFEWPNSHCDGSRYIRSKQVQLYCQSFRNPSIDLASGPSLRDFAWKKADLPSHNWA